MNKDKGFHVDNVLRPVSELAERMLGRRPSPNTIWRWIHRGNQRAGKLPAVKSFNRWCTSAEQFLRWMERTSVVDSDGGDEPSDRPAATQHALEAAGLL